jgi:hypothetical protein
MFLYNVPSLRAKDLSHPVLYGASNELTPYSTNSEVPSAGSSVGPFLLGVAVTREPNFVNTPSHQEPGSNSRISKADSIRNVEYEGENHDGYKANKWLGKRNLSSTDGYARKLQLEEINEQKDQPECWKRVKRNLVA